MRISHITIENFRSLRNLDTDLPQLCALVGPNNAGKSNLLLALKMLLSKDWGPKVSDFSVNDVFERSESLDVTITASFDPELQYQRFVASDPVAISSIAATLTRFKRGEQQGQLRLEQKPLAKANKIINVPMTAFKKGETTKFEPLTYVPTEVREQVPLIYIGTNRSLQEQLPSGRYSLLRRLLEDVNKSLNDEKQQLAYTDNEGKQQQATRLALFSKLMKKALAVLKTDEFNKLESSIKENALTLLGFDPVKDANKLDLMFAPFDTMDFYKALDIRVKEGDFEISASELGEGLQNAIVMAILQAFEMHKKKGAIILVEEPEMFLHPQLQRSLYKTLRNLAKTNQVIYTTHSPHFVSVPDYDEVLLFSKTGSETIVKASDLPSSRKLREKLIKELDPERNEMFFARKLILVEGDTEKLAIPVYAQRMGFDLDKEGITIVEVGGKRNLSVFAQIAKSFEIPTALLYDTESSEIQNAEEEAKLNAELNALAEPDSSFCVWALQKDYEDVLRAALGDESYTAMCEKYPRAEFGGKPTRARLIALEEAYEVPEIIRKVLEWAVA